mgnify:CR=1 FL=1
MLVRLLYASRAVDTSPAAIEAILTQSRQHNPGSGITGVLCSVSYTHLTLPTILLV